MKITITADHIKNGQRRNSSCCPLALAFKDAGYCHATVGSSFITLTTSHPHKYKHIRHTHQSILFMNHFDSGLGVIPLELEFPE